MQCEECKKRKVQNKSAQTPSCLFAGKMTSKMLIFWDSQRVSHFNVRARTSSLEIDMNFCQTSPSFFFFFFFKLI